jgi:hypothetical protein
MTDPNIQAAQKEAAAGLVQRARLFDQNAIGMIDSIRKNANMGNERAKSAFAAIAQYIRANPAKTSMGADVQTALGRIKHPGNSDEVILGSLGSLPGLGELDAVRVACILLSRGPALSRGRITRMHAVYPTQMAKDIFELGLDNCTEESAIAAFKHDLSESLEGVLCAGYCVGVGRSIQLAAMGKIPVTHLSRGIAWELGRLQDETEMVIETQESGESSKLFSSENYRIEEDVLTVNTADGRTVRRRLW